MESMELYSWHDMITHRMGSDDNWDNVVQCTLCDADLYVPFDACEYGGGEGEPFTVWTTKYVYFPAVYDNSVWVERVSRHPNGQPTQHVGGCG
jgi:hypothetical protein